MHISTTSPHDILDLLRSRNEIAIAADPELLAATLEEIDQEPAYIEVRDELRATYLRLAALLRITAQRELRQWLVSTPDDRHLRLCMVVASANSDLEETGGFDGAEFIERVLRVCMSVGRA